MGDCTVEKRMMDIRELSSYIGLKPQTIRNQISMGTFPIESLIEDKQ